MEFPCSMADIVADIERDIILEALRVTGNNKTEAARLVGMKRTTFMFRCEQRGIKVVLQCNKPKEYKEQEKSRDE